MSKGAKTAVQQAHAAASLAEQLKTEGKLVRACEQHRRAAECFHAAKQGATTEARGYLETYGEAHAAQAALLDRRIKMQEEMPIGKRGAVTESFMLVAEPGMSVLQFNPSSRTQVPSRKDAANAERVRTLQDHITALATTNASLEQELRRTKEELASKQRSLKELRRALKAQFKEGEWDGSPDTLKVNEQLQRTVAELQAALEQARRQNAITRADDELVKRNHDLKQSLLQLRQSIEPVMSSRTAEAIRSENSVLESTEHLIRELAGSPAPPAPAAPTTLAAPAVTSPASGSAPFLPAGSGLRLIPETSSSGLSGGGGPAAPADGKGVPPTTSRGRRTSVSSSGPSLSLEDFGIQAPPVAGGGGADPLPDAPTTPSRRGDDGPLFSFGTAAAITAPKLDDGGRDDDTDPPLGSFSASPDKARSTPPTTPTAGGSIADLARSLLEPTAPW